MEKYGGRWQDFLNDINEEGVFTKDQWQYQMHCRALEKVNQSNLFFVADSLPFNTLQKMSVHAVEKREGSVQQTLQALMDSLVADGMTVAVFPEGPYCAPVA